VLGPHLVRGRFLVDGIETVGQVLGEPVFVRRRRRWIDEQPTQFADSYFKADMVRGTQITQEQSGPGGVYARLEDAGHKLTRFTVELAFRMPTPEEARGAGPWGNEFCVLQPSSRSCSPGVTRGPALHLASFRRERPPGGVRLL
jgi:UTRA domain